MGFTMSPGAFPLPETPESLQSHSPNLPFGSATQVEMNFPMSPADFRLPDTPESLRSDCSRLNISPVPWNVLENDPMVSGWTADQEDEDNMLLLNHFTGAYYEPEPPAPNWFALQDLPSAANDFFPSTYNFDIQLEDLVIAEKESQSPPLSMDAPEREQLDAFPGTIIQNTTKEPSPKKEPKKKRGRPPKAAAPPSNLVQKEVLEEADLVKKPLKRPTDRPPVKYSVLAGLAMLNGGRPLNSQEIYKFCKYYFPGCLTGDYWKNSLRHTTCTYAGFIKTDYIRPDRTMGTRWSLTDEGRKSLEANLAALERSVPNPGAYGMSEPFLWKSIMTGRQGLPPEDVHVDIGGGESKKRKSPQPSAPAKKKAKPTSELVALLKQPPRLAPLQRHCDRFEPPDFRLDAFPVSPCSFEAAATFFDSPLRCSEELKPLQWQFPTESDPFGLDY